MNLLMPFVHVPPFWHGLEVQLFTEDTGEKKGQYQRNHTYIDFHRDLL